MPVTSDAAHLPIAQVLRLNAACEDCGRRFSMDRHAVAREQIRRSLTTPEALGSYLRCLLCVERGGEGRNISIVVQYVGARDTTPGTEPKRPPGRVAPAKPKWSRAPVFGEDRSNPHPNLPAARLMRG